MTRTARTVKLPPVLQTDDLSRQPALALDGVSKSFDGGATWAVADVSFRVARGAFLSLVGGSGSGKTTTLKMINRLVEPDRGAICIDGAPNTATPAHALRRGIGYVFQGVGLFPHMSVGENVAATPRLLGWPRAEIVARVDELLELVGLPPGEYRDRLPAMLSGGQRQRVGFARALAARPAIVLMDEPFGALDPVTRTTLAQAYRALHDELGLTTIMVTHDMTEALLMADLLGVMEKGRLVALDTPEALAHAPSHPYAEELLAAPRAQAAALARKFNGWSDG